MHQFSSSPGPISSDMTMWVWAFSAGRCFSQKGSSSRAPLRKEKPCARKICSTYYIHFVGGTIIENQRRNVCTMHCIWGVADGTAILPLPQSRQNTVGLSKAINFFISLSKHIDATIQLHITQTDTYTHTHTNTDRLTHARNHIIASSFIRVRTYTHIHHISIHRLFLWWQQQQQQQKNCEENLCLYEHGYCQLLEIVCVREWCI